MKKTSKYERKITDKQGDVLHLTEFPDEGSKLYRNSLTCFAIQINTLWDFTDPETGVKALMEQGDYLVKPLNDASVHAAKQAVFEGAWEKAPNPIEILEIFLKGSPDLVINLMRAFRYQNPGLWAELLLKNEMRDPFLEEVTP